MGTWGTGLFDNDAAADFMMDLEEANDVRSICESVFQEALESDYLESDLGSNVIVAAAYVDRQVNGTVFSEKDAEEPLAIDLFPDSHPHTDLRDLKPLARKALTRVLSQDSELMELWQENEEDFPVWKDEVAALMGRLA